MRGAGTIINVATVLAGTGAGLLVGARLPDRVRTTLLQGVGLVVVVLGLSSAQESRNVVFPLVAIAVGGLIGELTRLEDRLEGLGERIRRRVERPHPLADPAHPGPDEVTAEVALVDRAGADGDGADDTLDDGPVVDDGGRSRFVEAFVGSSLLFCVGPLAILGSVADGLSGDPQILVVKAALDGIVAVAFASTLGYELAFSAVTIALVQGTLTAGAGLADDALTPRMIAELTGTGGVIVLAIGLRLLEVVKIRVASFLPALVLAPAFVALFARP